MEARKSFFTQRLKVTNDRELYDQKRNRKNHSQYFQPKTHNVALESLTLQCAVSNFLRNTEKQESQREERRQIDRENRFLQMIYKKMQDLICHSYGRNETETIYSTGIAIQYEHDNFCRHIEERSGIKIQARANAEYSVTVDLTAAAKVCQITDANGVTVNLDFPALYAENLRRKQLWQQSEDDLAKFYLDSCKANLCNLPHKYLGIPKEVTVCNAKQQTPFQSKTSFRDMEIEYESLTATQIANLQARMNQFLAHGEVMLHVWGVINQSNLWIKISKAPEKDLPQAHFDYAEFYQPYDTEITLELQDFYVKIISEAKLASPKQYYQTLQSEHKLFYYFQNDKPNWEDVQARLKNDIHKQDLLDALSHAMPGIHFTEALCKRETIHHGRSMRGCGLSHTEYQNERIEFTFEIINPKSNFAKIFFRQYRQIKAIQQRARKIYVSRIIQYLLQILKNALQAKDADALHHQQSAQMLPIELHRIKLGEYQIDLQTVTDQDFLKSIEKMVKERSGGLISLKYQKSFKYYYYLINFR